MNYFLNRLLLICVILMIPLTSGSQESGDYLLRVKSLIDRGMYGTILEESGSAQGDNRILLMFGEAALREGDYSLAAGYYNKADRLIEGSGELGLARVYAAKGDAATAVYHLEQHLASSFRQPERELLKDPFLMQIEESRLWIQLWQKEWYNTLERGVAEVEYLVSRGRVNEAGEVALTFKGLYSGDPAVDYIGGVLAYAAGNYSEASSFLRKSLNGEPERPGVWDLYIKSLLEEGDYYGVVRASEEASSLFPESIDFRISKAKGLMMTGDRDGAYRAATNLLQFYPDKRELLTMAASLAGSSGNYSDALGFLSRNIENNRGDASSFAGRGDLYLASGSYEFAQSDYSMALDLDPRNGDIWFSKAKVLIYEERIDEACHDLKMALRYGNKKAAALINRHCIGR